MFAVIRTGGKQYRVNTGDVISVEKLETGKQQKCVFDDVLLLADGKEITLGTPNIEGAQVEAELLGDERGKKITIYKSRQRNTYRRKLGHRQDLSLVKITAINNAAGKKAEAKTDETKTASKPSQSKTVPDKTETKSAKKPAPKTSPADVKKGPAKGKCDDLTMLKGIGPTLAEKLVNAGIKTFSQIAALSKAEIEKTEQELKISGRFAKDNWVAQAKTLVENQEKN